MKTYKEFEKVFIGDSDSAFLTMVGAVDDVVSAAPLHFGQDDSYKAYIVDEPAKIGNHYKLVATFEKWLRIYDDDEKVREFRADRINVYRAGEMGCIIELKDAPVK